MKIITVDNLLDLKLSELVLRYGAFSVCVDEFPILPKLRKLNGEEATVEYPEKDDRLSRMRVSLMINKPTQSADLPDEQPAESAAQTQG